MTSTGGEGVLHSEYTIGHQQREQELSPAGERMAADEATGCVMETLCISASDDEDEALFCELKFSHSVSTYADESVSNTDCRSSTLIMSSHLSS